MNTIKKAFAILIIIVAVTMACCTTDTKKTDTPWSVLPHVTDLDQLQQTEFVITLENPVDSLKNTIYTPTFLYTWDEIRIALKSNVVLGDSNSQVFRLLSHSSSHQHSLEKNEYTASAEVVEGAIFASAFFNKTLPFETELQEAYNPIHFEGARISAFGMHHYEEACAKIARILYYQDDDNFILELIPKDKNHQIILAKGLNQSNTLKDAVEKIEMKINQGNQERSDAKQSWKYEIKSADIFAIPVIRFNIATHLSDLEGEKFFTTDKEPHIIAEAYQRTGFILTRQGAVIESYDTTSVDSVRVPTPILEKPKNMIFNKAFVVMAKRTDQKNPYFVITINNAELLEKQ
jgi:phage gpG-like protein